jgi:hypothetical protein
MGSSASHLGGRALARRQARDYHHGHSQILPADGYVQ